jgi:hypothetical protein
MTDIIDPERRSIMRAGVLAGATLGLGALLADKPAHAAASAGATAGDVAILQFLLVAEAVETDLWEQYAELVTNNEGYREALSNTDPSFAQYIVDTARDERSHATFIAAYLTSIGVDPVDLSSFYQLEPPRVEGLTQTPRLTNLTNLTVDTSWYVRYRTSINPDFNQTAPQFLTIADRPTIPTSNRVDRSDLRLIADSAAFHFAAIEQGGTSLYAQFLPKVSSHQVLQIVAGIGPVEAIHFGVFQTSLEGLKGDATADGKLVFPDLRNNALLSESVMPAPCNFISESLPLSSVVRPASTKFGGATAAATGLVKSGLFSGQPPSFFTAVTELAQAADAAQRNT